MKKIIKWFFILLLVVVLWTFIAKMTRPLPMGSLSSRSCYRKDGRPKVDYKTGFRARLSNWWNHHVMDGDELEAYRCPHCGGVHLGHKKWYDDFSEAA